MVIIWKSCYGIYFQKQGISSITFYIVNIEEIMKVTVEGIILNETNYSETSKILNILTKEYGYISVISKGSRTLKSKLRGISMKLVYANFTITYKEKGISVLNEGMVIHSFKNIMTSFEKMNYANYIVQIVKSVLKENNTTELFGILKSALIKINDGFDSEIITNILLIKMLKYLGVNPSFSNCIFCDSSDILTFDMDLAGNVCQSCYKDTYLFSKTTLKLLKLFQVVDLSKIDKLNITSKKVREEINLFIKEYYEKYTGIYIGGKEKLHFIKW